MKINSFTDLTVWQQAQDLALHIYRITKQFPKDELFGLTSQMRRAAVSVPSNIAEGFHVIRIKKNSSFILSRPVRLPSYIVNYYFHKNSDMLIKQKS